MAIVTFGAAARANSSVGIKNTTNTNLVIGLFHGVVLLPGATKFLTFNEIDNRTRFNPRNHMINDINSGGALHPYLDDVNEFGFLLKNGTLVAYTATQTTNLTGFILGTQLATSFVGGDNSVFFS